MKVLVTGAAGLLGSHLAAALEPLHEVVGTDRHPWAGERSFTFIEGELQEQAFVDDVLRGVRPDLVFHCAGVVNVDACERDPQTAYRANGDVTASLARTLAPDALFVYVTTDGIFRGDRPFASEEWLPCPRTVYGRSKLHGEWDVELTRKAHLIIRTNFYGWSSGRKQTSVEWLYSALSRGERITLFNDFFFTPIYVVDLVDRMLRLVRGGHRGRFHVVGRDRVSKHGFGVMLADVASLPATGIASGSIDDADLPAPRPKDMSLASARLEAALDLQSPSCLDGLKRCVADRGRPIGDRVRPLHGVGAW